MNMAEFPAFGFKPRSLHKTQKHTTTQPSQELLISPGRGSLSRKGHCPGSARVQQGRCVRQLLSSSHSGNVTTDSVFLPINMHICNRNKNCTSRLPPHRFNCKINNPVIKKAGQSRKKKFFRPVDILMLFQSTNFIYPHDLNKLCFTEKLHSPSFGTFSVAEWRQERTCRAV